MTGQVWITQGGRTWLYRPPGRPTAVAPARTLNQQKQLREIQRNVTAENRSVPVVYGRAQIGGLIFALDYDSSSGLFTIGYLLCQGEIGAINSVWFDDEPAAAGVTVNEYTGAAGQGVDPLLAAAISGYNDTLDGLAYIVVQFGANVYETWPRVVAEIDGKKVLDPRVPETAFSRNPALHLADLISSSDYGLGLTVDSASLIAAADACDDTTGIGEARREAFTVIESRQETESWVETLRTYAGCFVVYRGDTVHLIPDRPTATAATFTASDIVAESLSIRKKDGADLPTVMQVYYTDTTGNEWRERQADEVSIPGAQRRVSQIRLPGITRHSQAYREAIERLNKMTLSDLEVTFQVFDEGLELEAGDVISVTHPYGLSNKLLRLVQSPAMAGVGLWNIVAEEYDAAAYSDQVITQPSAPDTNLPANAPPDAPTGLTIGETTYQLQNGKYASRLDLSWDASTSAYVTGYAVKVYEGATVVWATVINSTSVSTSPLRELVNYTVEVRAQTALFSGDAVTGNYSIIGKTAIPDAPATVNGFEVAGEVRLNWPASTDVDAERYEIRYGVTSGGSWDTANVLDRVDGLRFVSRDVPEGTWRFYVRTIDSIGQYSNDEATVDLVVTLDNDAFSAASLTPLGEDGITGVLTDIHTSVEERGSDLAVYYADGGDSWASMFGASAMDTFTEALSSYQTLSGTAGWLSAEIDLLENVSGNWRTAVDFEDFGNNVNIDLQLQVDGGGWFAASELSVQETVRKARVAVYDNEPFYVRGDGGFLRADVVAREETGEGTSLASGATTIMLSRRYASARSIILTPQGIASRVAVFDNIVLDNGGVTSFDVYVFDSAGNQVANDFRWQWKGV